MQIFSSYQTSEYNGGTSIGELDCPETRMRVCAQRLKILPFAGIYDDQGMTQAYFACCRVPLNAIIVAKGKTSCFLYQLSISVLNIKN